MTPLNLTPSIERDPSQESLLKTFYEHYKAHDYKAASKELEALGEDMVRYLKRANPVQARTLAFRGLLPKI